MLKFIVLACLCSALFVNGFRIKTRGFSDLLSESEPIKSVHQNEHNRPARQAPGQEQMPEGEVNMDHKSFGSFSGDFSQQQPPESNDHQRNARQAPGQNGPNSSGGYTPGQGNLAMQGLGNIPDPTSWVMKGQEVASQFARGRRQAPSKMPTMH